MIWQGFLQISLILLTFAVLSPLLGRYIANVFQSKRTWLDRFVSPLEQLIYALGGLRYQESMIGWQYARAVLYSNLVMGILVYLILVFQAVLPFNVVATSGRAVEACGDVNTLVLGKTGTITLRNRLAEEFIPVGGHSVAEVAIAALTASVFDDTPEGKSIVRLAEKLKATVDFDPDKAEGIEFSARTRMSGTDLPDGGEVRKGAVDAIRGFVRSRGGQPPSDLNAAYERISKLDGTPLAVCENSEIYGVIYLKDIIKPGIKERFDQLHRMGVHTVMLTGDNRITASVIAQEVGVDDFIAEATPEDKIEVIQAEQAQGKLVAMAETAPMMLLLWRRQTLA